MKKILAFTFLTLFCLSFAYDSSSTEESEEEDSLLTVDDADLSSYHENLAFHSPYLKGGENLNFIPTFSELQKRGGDNPPTIKKVSFLHGVATGDPFHDSVVFWTKVTPTLDDDDEDRLDEVDVPLRLIIGKKLSKGRTLFDDPKDDQNLGIDDVVFEDDAPVLTSSKIDFTMKRLVPGLEPNTKYFYRFVWEENGKGKKGKKVFSPLARTKTLPHPDSDNVPKLRIAAFSCSNMPQGYFTAYKLASEKDLDVVLHLGDYIYEYPNKEYGDGTKMGRVPKPDKKLDSLEDFRTRHAQYKQDPDLSYLHRLVPFINTWDDHEVADNAWKDGALKVSSAEFQKKKGNGIRAFFEYQPVRQANGRLEVYRTFQAGNLFDLIMLDTRYHGRDNNEIKGTAAESQNRTILGFDQEEWLFDELKKSKERNVPFRLLGNQVIIAPNWGPVTYQNIDSWDGYPASRTRLFDVIKGEDIGGVVFLTGDVHSAWVHDVPYHKTGLDPFHPKNYDSLTGAGSIATEFVGTSVTAQFAFEIYGVTALKGFAHLFRKPNLKFFEAVKHGYMVFEVTPEQLTCDYYFLNTVMAPKGVTEARVGPFAVKKFGKSVIVPNDVKKAHLTLVGRVVDTVGDASRAIARQAKDLGAKLKAFFSKFK